MQMVKGITDKARLCLKIGLILLFVIASVNAAEYHGQVVFNGSGVPGVTITASQADKKYAIITDARGQFSFPELSDGIWNIQTEMQAFAPLRQDVTIGPGMAAGQLELSLLPIDQIQGLKTPPPSVAPPEAAASVKTTAEASTAKKAKPDKKGATPSPANTQTPFQRTEVNATGAAAQPSVGLDNTSAPPQNTTFGDASPAELSQRAADGFLINGTSNNSAGSPFAQSRAFGNNRGLIRSRYNGNIGFTIQNSALDARTYSLTGIDTARPSYNRTQGSFSIGGPLQIPWLVRNGPNFYLGYQFARNRDARIESGLVPTLAEREGDLSQAPGQIYDPTTNLPITNNRISEDRISRQAKSLLSLFPLPNFTGSTSYNYQAPVVSAAHQDSVFFNLNKSVGNKNHLTGTFSLSSSRSDNPTLFGFLDTSHSLGSNLQMNWRHVFTQRLFVTLGYRFGRQSSHTNPFFANRENISGVAGITGNNQAPLNWGPPNLIFSGGLTSLSDATASSSHNQSNGITASGFWSRSRHNISFGGEYQRQQLNLISQENPRGSFTFNGASTRGALTGIALPGARNDFAGFLLGIPDTVGIAFGNADKYFRYSSYNAFISDDYRITRNLTLNAGIRWEYNSPITELKGRLVNLDIAPEFSAVVPVVAGNPFGSLTGMTYPESLLHPRKYAFQPRLAFSWKPISASSLLVRGGYGIYYNSSPYMSIAMQMAQQSPLSKSLSLQNTAATPLTLESGFNATPNTTTNTFGVDPDLKIGYVHIWQLSIQVDLPAALQLSATYQGNRGRHALQEFLPNTYPAGAENPCPACPAGFAYMTSNGTSTREAGIVQLRRRMRNGFTATLQYTYSKAIDNAAPGGSGQSSVFIAQNWRNLRGERALSSFDQRYVASIQFQYTTGMGLAGGTLLKGWKGALFKEWTISSQINASSGLPLTPIYSYAVLGTGFTGPLRPDYTGESIYAAPSGLHLNPAAYQVPAAGQWGNAGRNSITGPSQFTMNASMQRTFRTSDRTSLELSVNANNALNHVSFRSWDTTVGSARFGLPTAANSMRIVQTNIRWRF